MIEGLVILENAAEEVASIWFWYEAQQAGLEDQFHEEFYRILAHISDYKESGVRYKRNYRQVRLLKFPYLIMYELENDLIIIYAVLHTSRHPKKRIEKTVKRVNVQWLPQEKSHSLL